MSDLCPRTGFLPHCHIAQRRPRGEPWQTMLINEHIQDGTGSQSAKSPQCFRQRDSRRSLNTIYGLSRHPKMWHISKKYGV